MGIFDRFDYSERQRRKRLKNEAREYRTEAKNLLADAKSYYEDYKDAKRDARDEAYELEKLLKGYNQQKIDILRELGGEISGTIENFKRFKIPSRPFNIPKVDTNSMPNIPTFTATHLMSVIPCSNFNPINLILSVFSDPEKDRDEAIEQRDKAQEYCYKVEDAKNEMEAVRDSIYATKRYIEDERTCISQLMEKLRSLIVQLNAAMNQQTYSEKSARYMTGICKIAEQIKGTLETQITDNSGRINSNYRMYSQRIRTINRSIPERPTISSSNNWLDTLIQ